MRGQSQRGGRGRGRGGRFPRGGRVRKDVPFPNVNEKNAKIGILSEDTMSYYRNVSTSLESGFEDEDLKDQFLTNVFETLKEEGVQVAQNQTVSRILEMLFHHSKPHHMRELFVCFCRQLAIVTFDPFASHVFQSLIQHLPAMYEHKESSQDFEAFLSSLKSLCQFMESHMRDVMTHTYASHVLRALLEALAGVKVKVEVIRSRVSRTSRKEQDDSNRPTTDKALSQDFQESFEMLKDKLLRLCNYEDHLSDTNYCPVLQTVLLILHKTSQSEYAELAESLVQRTCVLGLDKDADINDPTKRLPHLVQNEVGSYLVELLISLASDGQLKKLYQQLFKEKIIYFCVHGIANYVLQKLLAVLTDEKMLMELLTEICQYLEDILAVGHIGIVTKLSEACVRTGAGQEQFLQAILSAFHCREPEEKQIKLAPLVAAMKTYEMFFPSEELESRSSLLKDVNIHGSLILQQLLQFSSPKLVVSSVLDLSPSELAGLCCDKCGSHIVDVFFQSETIYEKNKTALLKKLAGMYVNIGCNRNGSRCLETIWKGSAIKQKIFITEELLKNQERLEGDQWGRFLYRNFGLAMFSQRRKEWLQLQGASGKKQQLLQDILQGKSNKKKRQKNQESSKDENAKTQERELPPESAAATVIFPQAEVLGQNHTDNTSDNREEKRKKNKRKYADSQSDSQEPCDVISVKKHKKSKSDRVFEEGSPTVNEEKPTEIEDSSPHKKRKRKKEKKRKIRNAELAEATVSPTDQGQDSISHERKKKKKRKEAESQEEEEETIMKKKRKSHTTTEATEDSESNIELVHKEKSSKKERGKSEKKEKLKEIKTKS